MAGVDAPEILLQIQALALDKLQVVSYKWLSRNFAVSSNCAKRLLQEFVDKYGNELEVIYTLSGWLKSNPQTYCIKLASGLKLAEMKSEFKDNCSVHVYSVQPCIPKDLAVLWSAEFVQAEELFNQPSTEENCLRDNRFCGVSNSFVKRTIDAKHVGIAPPKPVKGLGVTMQPKTNSSLKEQPIQPPQQGLVGQPSKKQGMESSSATMSDKSDKITSEVINKASKPSVVTEPNAVLNTNKRKGPSEKASSGSTGSLASLWGRATTKPKLTSSAIENANDVTKVTVTSEAQICAREAAEAASSDDDDEKDINYKREATGANSRKRRMVVDFSDDDDDEENVVSLASPHPPSGRPIVDSLCSTGNLAVKDKKLDSNEHNGNLVVEDKELDSKERKKDTLEDRQGIVKGKTSGLLSEADVGTESKSIVAGLSLQPKTHSHIPEALGDKNNKDLASNSSSTSPKRRKVLKTRIDERGREVTEVLWEVEAAGSNGAEKTAIAKDAGNRPPLANKSQAAGSGAPANPVSKAGNKKPTKGGGKDTKQGNILSFFKRI